MYLWAHGIYSGLRAEGQRLCTLVVVGVNGRGEKRFLAIEDGVRESTQSWREVLLDLKARGLKQPPELAVGALDEVFPKTRRQRCWVHKTANILNSLPKSVQPKVKGALHEIWQARGCVTGTPCWPSSTSSAGALKAVGAVSGVSSTSPRSSPACSLKMV